jgi:nitrate reductase delta subunit
VKGRARGFEERFQPFLGKKAMTDVYKTLAELLEYPQQHWTARLESARAMGNETDSFARFMVGVQTLSLSDLQELYTRTFDLNPVCALDIGYHLFGENYKRGQFLASLRETESQFDLGQEHQLPDYLPVLLRLLKKLDDEELRTSLIGECLIPAIDKMIAALKDGDNPYRALLEAVQTTLRSEASVVSIEPPQFKMRASLPVLTDDRDLLSGSAARCAVAALPHRDDPLQFNWGYAPETQGAAPDFEDLVPEGHRPSAYQAAEPQSDFIRQG